jgi:hypothetical protein
MTTQNLPLNIWLVVQQRLSWRDIVLVSTHDTQDAAEAERDRLNQSSGHRPFRACIVIEPMAQRMGGQFAPTTHNQHQEVKTCSKSQVT